LTVSDFPGRIPAKDARPGWRAMTAKERAAILRRWFDLMLANQDDLAQLMTAEQGKPLAEAKGEVAYAASFIEWFAEEGKRIYGDVIPATQNATSASSCSSQPIGVVPRSRRGIFRGDDHAQGGPALAAGCTVVSSRPRRRPIRRSRWRNSPSAPEFPRGRLQCRDRLGQAIGGEMTGNPLVRKLTFTGSTEIGKLLMAQCAGTVKKVSLELGGNAPFIVFDDADLDAAVEGAIASKYRNTGQTCVCANRLLVQDGVYDAFAKNSKKSVAS
jgi:succinate-semialdehyde dehydrogenase / glutarate-semialdehyde dehydrogenase